MIWNSASQGFVHVMKQYECCVTGCRGFQRCFTMRDGKTKVAVCHETAIIWDKNTSHGVILVLFLFFSLLAITVTPISISASLESLRNQLITTKSGLHVLFFSTIYCLKSSFSGFNVTVFFSSTLALNLQKHLLQAQVHLLMFIKSHQVIHLE